MRPKSDRKKKHDEMAQVFRTHLENKQRYGNIIIARTFNKHGVK